MPARTRRGRPHSQERERAGGYEQHGQQADQEPRVHRSTVAGPRRERQPAALEAGRSAPRSPGPSRDAGPSVARRATTNGRARSPRGQSAGTKKRPRTGWSTGVGSPGNDLLSRVSTIIGGSCLTTVFGMGTGMARLPMVTGNTGRLRGTGHGARPVQPGARRGG